MFREEVRAQIWALILLSVGGLLLHVRIHPPLESAFNWLPVVICLGNVIVLPILFNRRSTAPWGYALTSLTVVAGTVAMAWFSATNWKGPLTPWTLILNSTLADILILCAKLPIAHNILVLSREVPTTEEGVVLPETPADVLTGERIPAAEGIAEPRVLSPAACGIIRAASMLVGLVLVATAAWIGARSYSSYVGSMPTVQVLLIVSGKTAGLVAATLFMLQFTLSARVRFLDRAFGLDRLLLYHGFIGAGAGTLALLHPTLLFASTSHELGPAGLVLWRESLGIAAALLVVAILLTSRWRVFLGLSYEAWHRVHYLVFAVVIAMAAHSLTIGDDLSEGWRRVFWQALIGAYAGLFLWAKLIRPALLRRRRYVVESVRPVSHNTHNVTLRPAGGPISRHLPGQFAFLTLRREGLPDEPHPFTISSPPAGDGTLSFTIKGSGDFTSTIDRTRVGDTATIDGPYGRFSHLLRGDRDLVMIAGGVGITPILSMLRYMAATGDRRNLTLIWGNRTEADILFRDELAEMESRMPALRVHHVLSHQEEWSGEQGYVDETMLRRLLDEAELGSDVFLCGPPPMMTSVREALHALGFPHGKIHTERFAL